MAKDNTNAIKNMLDEMQADKDFSFFTSEVRGKELSEKQEATKKYTKKMLDALEDPKTDRDIRGILARG